MAENSSTYSKINQIVIVAVFLLFASVAFYFTFRDSKNEYAETQSTDYFISPLEKKLADHYHNVITENTVGNHKIAPHNESTTTCLDESYFRQMHWVSQLQYSFASKQRILPLLNIFNSAFPAKGQALEYKAKLDTLFAKDEIYDIAVINNKYNDLRHKITKELYEAKFNNSILAQWVLKAVNIQSRGKKAMEAGEPESTLEVAGNLLAGGNILETYRLIEPLSKNYGAAVNDWLDYTLKYIEVKNTIIALDLLVNAKEYKENFIRVCNNA